MGTARRFRLGLTILVLLAFGGLLFAPQAASLGAHSSSGPVFGNLVPIVAAPHLASPTQTMAHASAGMTFPRTVLIETVTGVWCIHCPAESSALYQIDQQTSHSQVAIAELHFCYYTPGTGPCLDNYGPPDNTSYQRNAFYNVCGGVPVVFTDGQHNVCGAYDSIPQMYGIYQSLINNASAYAGNVSIAQSAVVQGSTVVAQLNITSGLTGSYNVVSYLLEFINKKGVSNGYGPHDIANVVRETLHNHPASLVAGSSTDLTVTGPILAGWNSHNLSVVSFVQANSTKIVENSNFAPVTTMSEAVLSDHGSLNSTSTAMISVHVVNTTTQAPVVGASVVLTSFLGGTLAPTSGFTDASGNFVSTYTAPNVTAAASDAVTASVTATGYTGVTASTSIWVKPNLVPAAPTALAIAPGVGELTLSWAAPRAAGAGSLVYSVYVASASSGPFTLLGTSTTTSYRDTGLVAGQVLWFEVAAQNTAGFGPLSAAINAASVAVSTTGLPSTQGWWMLVGTQLYTSPGPASQVLFLPPGSYTYSYGAQSYAWITVASIPSGTWTVGSSAQSVSFEYAPRVATLTGTVNPAGASVLLNGAALQVTNGGFFTTEPAGQYYLNVSSSGYVTNSSVVTLTPGNTTSVLVKLTSNPTTGAGGGLTPFQLGIIIGPAATAIAAVGGILALKARSRRRAAESEPEPDPTEPES